jgi:hypothetical protein
MSPRPTVTPCASAHAARHVEQHAAADQAVAHRLDAANARPRAGHVLEAEAVVHRSVVEDVTEGVPVRARLQRHRDRVVGVTQAGEVILGAQQDVAAVLEHVQLRVGAPEVPGLRAVAVVRDRARDDVAALDESGRRGDRRLADEVQRAELVLRPPLAPAPVAQRERLDVSLRVRSGHRHNVRTPPAEASLCSLDGPIRRWFAIACLRSRRETENIRDIGGA